MTVFNAAFPILPGKLEAARAFAEEAMGDRRADFDEAQRRQGVTRETWSIQEMPDGSALVLVWFDSPDPQAAIAEVVRDPSDFGVWFRERVKDINGIDLSEPVEGVGEVILDWRG